MKKERSFLRIPMNRIIALVLMDIMAILISSFAALYLRFEFSFREIPKEYLNRYERIIPYTVGFTLLFFLIWRLYKSVWRYASATELLNISFATSSAALAQMILSRENAVIQAQNAPKGGGQFRIRFYKTQI